MHSCLQEARQKLKQWRRDFWRGSILRRSHEQREQKVYMHIVIKIIIIIILLIISTLSQMIVIVILQCLKKQRLHQTPRLL